MQPKPAHNNTKRNQKIVLCNYLCCLHGRVCLRAVLWNPNSQIKENGFLLNINVLSFFSYSNHFHGVLQLSVRREGELEGGSEKALQALPVHHPRKENVQGAAAAQTHEARECKWLSPRGLSSLFVCIFVLKLLSKFCVCVHYTLHKTRWNG